MDAAPSQERLLGEDGNPRKTKENEDPFRMGLVLEWVYGTIVSTAEKARDSAKKPLGVLQPHAKAVAQLYARAMQLESSLLMLAQPRRPLIPTAPCCEAAGGSAAPPLLERSAVLWHFVGGCAWQTSKAGLWCSAQCPLSTEM